MDSLVNQLTNSKPDNRIRLASIQVLQVYKDPVAAGKEDTHLHAVGIDVHHTHVAYTLKAAEVLIDRKQIDVVIVDHECALPEIGMLREVAARKGVPIIICTLKFDWKAKEIAIECGIDEYHVGPLDLHFAKRVKLIKKLKAMKVRQWKSHLDSSRTPSIKFWLLKRSFDIAVSLFVILLLLPILTILLPLLFLNTKGSVLSSSQRVGRNYKVFNLYEFAYFSTTTVSKATGVWRLFPRLHLARLPQILNVLKGDMSIVGNYPVTTEEAEKLTRDGIAWRFVAPAGLVGLWKQKTEPWDPKQDLEYAMTNSLLLDLRILSSHFLSFFRQQGKDVPACALEESGISRDYSLGYSTQNEPRNNCDENFRWYGVFLPKEVG